MAINEPAPPPSPRDAETAAPSQQSPPTGSAGAQRGGGLGLRDRIPELGLTQYWYPAIASRKVPSRKGVRRTILGRELVFFRGAAGDVVAMSNWCPHRNASLAQGKPTFAGPTS